MADLDILRAVSESSLGDDKVLHPGIVRFKLELKNPSNERSLRKETAKLLGAGRFSSAPLGSLLPSFYILQLPGVPRTMALNRLFAIADAFLTSGRDFGPAVCARGGSTEPATQTQRQSSLGSARPRSVRVGKPVLGLRSLCWGSPARKFLKVSSRMPAIRDAAC